MTKLEQRVNRVLEKQGYFVFRVHELRDLPKPGDVLEAWFEADFDCDHMERFHAKIRVLGPATREEVEAQLRLADPHGSGQFPFYDRFFKGVAE